MKSQYERLEEAKEIIRSVYWECVDNKEVSTANRLDTIVGKIKYLQEKMKVAD